MSSDVDLHVLDKIANALSTFFTTPHSFHGVEPIADAHVRRDLLLYDIQVENPPEPIRPVTQPAAAPGSHFSF